MEQSHSSELGSFSVGQEIHCVLRNPRVRFGILKFQPMISVQGRINPVYNLPPCFFRVYFNIIFLSVFSSPRWSLYSLVPTKFLRSFLLCPTCTADSRGTNYLQYVSIGLHIFFHKILVIRVVTPCMLLESHKLRAIQENSKLNIAVASSRNYFVRQFLSKLRFIHPVVNSSKEYNALFLFQNKVFIIKF